jgi:hypothetical protein
MTITLFGRQLWPRPAPKHRRPPDPRSLIQQYEYGPDRYVPDHRFGSMQLADETQWRYSPASTAPSRAGETIMLPRFGRAVGYDSIGGHWYQRDPAAPREYYDPAADEAELAELPPLPPYVCRCDPAADDHDPACPVYGARPWLDPGAAEEYLPGGLDEPPWLGPAGGEFDPDEGRPPWEPEPDDPGPERCPVCACRVLPAGPAVGLHCPRCGWIETPAAELADLIALDPEHAEEILAHNAEVRQYLADRAAAHAALRAQNLAAWRALRPSA